MLYESLQWLWLCAGETTPDCRKLDMNAESPSWTNAPNLPCVTQLVRYIYTALYLVDIIYISTLLYSI